MTRHRFFEPHIGSKYQVGIKGKKILVIGASFYCKTKECQYYNLCTSDKYKDSSKYDDCCKDLQNKGLLLHNYPSISRKCDDDVKANRNFAQFLQAYIKSDSVWDYVAFTNYIQYFLGHRSTHSTNITESDFESFKETVIELEPDIIVTWGKVVQNEIMDNHRKHIIDYDENDKNNWWLRHIMFDEVHKAIPILFSWHPSSSKWNSDLKAAHIFFEKALNE